MPDPSAQLFLLIRLKHDMLVVLIIVPDDPTDHVAIGPIFENKVF